MTSAGRLFPLKVVLISVSLHPVECRNTALCKFPLHCFGRHTKNPAKIPWIRSDFQKGKKCSGRHEQFCRAPVSLGIIPVIFSLNTPVLGAMAQEEVRHLVANRKPLAMRVVSCVDSNQSFLNMDES